MMRNHKSKIGFTLLELMVVIVIGAITASIAIPNYVKSVERGHYQDAVQQLKAIYTANKMYSAAHPNPDPTISINYWPSDAAAHPVADINTNLSLNIIEDEMTYSCIRGTTPRTTYTCTATRTGGSFTVTLTEAALSTTAPKNPSCTGTCPD